MTQAQETRRMVKLPLPVSEVRELMRGLHLWTLAGKQIEREFTFKDFKEAVIFVDLVADAADKEEHHPDISISDNRVRLTLTTPQIGGLSRNDFILASRIDEIVSLM